jgi:type VI protein secretion system component Hcp
MYTSFWITLYNAKVVTVHIQYTMKVYRGREGKASEILTLKYMKISVKLRPLYNWVKDP